MKKDLYCEKYIKLIKNQKSKKELEAIINKIYEDGFNDGNDCKE
jgi:hypothetical protein